MARCVEMMAHMNIQNLYSSAPKARRPIELTDVRNVSKSIKRSRSERVTGAKNAQLVCINGGSPRQPSTPQLLRILEETIQKKEPKPLYQKSSPVKDLERYRLTFNIPDKTADSLFQYRTKFVQHMLTSPMYANSAVGKPWEMIGRLVLGTLPLDVVLEGVSLIDKIIDEVILSCAKEMQLHNIINNMYKSETK